VILCLDSATLADLIRGRSPDVRDNYCVAVQAGFEFAVPAVVMHELFAGMLASRNRAVERERMDEALVGLPVIDLAAGDVETTGRVASDLRTRGRPIGDIDTLIAGQALARGWTVVTRNVRHFGRVEVLPLVDWSIGPELLSAEAIAARVGVAE
jgi:tRNA(fMet)-specific endonuclease VapC